MGPTGLRAPTTVESASVTLRALPGMPNVMLMEPRFLSEVLTTLSAGKGARRGAGLVHLAVLLQRGHLPKGFATVRTREGSLGRSGGIRRGQPGACAMAALVSSKGLGGGEGSGAGEADEEGSL